MYALKINASSALNCCGTLYIMYGNADLFDASVCLCSPLLLSIFVVPGDTQVRL